MSLCLFTCPSCCSVHAVWTWSVVCDRDITTVMYCNSSTSLRLSCVRRSSAITSSELQMYGNYLFWTRDDTVVSLQREDLHTCHSSAFAIQHQLCDSSAFLSQLPNQLLSFSFSLSLSPLLYPSLF